MSHIISFTEFRREIKQKIIDIYKEEESLIAITQDNEQLQDVIEKYDEDFSKPFVEIVQQEIDSFLNNTTNEY
jgi:predicted lactoylglutathione lyase